jgi:hypothetical protein
MHFATLNHIHLTKTPDFDLAAQITLDEKGARRLWQIKALAFESSGRRRVVHLVLFASAMVNIPEHPQVVSVTAASQRITDRRFPLADTLSSYPGGRRKGEILQRHGSRATVQ